MFSLSDPYGRDFKIILNLLKLEAIEENVEKWLENT